MLCITTMLNEHHVAHTIHVGIINETSSDKTVKYFYIYYIVGVYLVTRNRQV